MRPSDWDNPQIREIGRRWAAEAYDLASELHNYGADAARLLSPEQYPDCLPSVEIPTRLADALMTLLLSLPRPSWAPDPPLGENVTILRMRSA